MNTTAKMCIEHIVIGLQATWIIIYLFICKDDSVLLIIKDLNSLTHIFIVLPISYVLGIAIDRVAKYCMGIPYKRYLEANGAYIEELKHEDSRKRHVCKRDGYCEKMHHTALEDCRGCEMMKISKLVWKYHNEMDYFDDLFSRVRIIRGSCLNTVILLLVMVITYIQGTAPSVVSSNILFLCSLLILVIILFYCTDYKLLSQYYHKERVYTYEMLMEEKKKAEA